MGRGCWSGGMQRTPLSPVVLRPGLLGKLCCFGTGKGRDWQTGLVLWHFPATPGFGITWCSSMPTAVLCALANPVGSAQGSAYFPPTPGHCCLSPCGSSKLSQSKCQGEMGLFLLPLALPWGSPTSNHHSEAFGCSWLSPACCFCHSFCMVRLQQPQLCP